MIFAKHDDSCLFCRYFQIQIWIKPVCVDDKSQISEANEAEIIWLAIYGYTVTIQPIDWFD